jgi:putative SOS response-associated peptidase YedK
MCNRYRMSAKQAELAHRFGVDPKYIMPEPEPLPPPELFPKRIGRVVRKEGGARVLETMRWGFPPPAAARAPVTNVRNLSSPFWRSALNRPDRRCLVPVTEFCEWSGEKGSKREHWFSLPSAPIFAFAGVWRPTEEGNAFAFLT